MKKNYYGFAHNFGANMGVQGAPHGDGGTLHVFGSKKTRDEWVIDGPACIGERGARTVYPASKVRAHVKDHHGYGTGDMTTRELVESALKHGIVSDGDDWSVQ